MMIIAQNRNRRLQKVALVWIALLLPSLFALYLALTASPLSVRDYWAIMNSVYSTAGFSTNLANWLVSQNGHIVFIPRLIYVLNLFVTNGSNVGLTLTAWGLAMVQAVLLIYLISPDIRDFRVRLLVVIAISGFSFAPTATDNWLHGFSGVHWILSNVFSLGAIVCITRYFRRGRSAWLIAAFLLAGLALITYGTALGVWLALIAGFVFMRSRWRVGLLVIGLTALVFAISLASRPFVPPSSVTWLDRLIVFVPYLAIFIGGIFTINIPLAFLVGLVGLVGGLWVIIKFGFRADVSTRLAALPWLLVLVYSLVNIAFIALTRLEFGLGYATTMRYVTLSGPYWIVILVMWAYQRYRTRERYSWPALIPYLVTVAVLLLAMLPLGLDRAHRLIRQTAVQPLAILSVNLNMPDQPLIDQVITVSEHYFLAQVPALKDDGLVPFDRPVQDQCGRPGESLELARVSDTASITGDFEFIDPVTPDGVRAIGWLETAPDSIECMILADQNGIIRGKALSGFFRPDLQNSAKIGWAGYARLTHPDDQLAVYLKLANRPTWIALPQTRSRSNPGNVRLEVYRGLVGDIYDNHVGLESFNRFLGNFGYTPPKIDIQRTIDD